MTTFKELAEAWIASREHCSGSLGGIRFWVDEFGPLQVDQISEDPVDQAINRLVARGKLRGGTGKDRGQPTGQPLSGSTNRSSTEQSQRLSELAKTYTEEALDTLVDVARNGRTDAARVSAANALLDRAYGKPAVKEEKEIVDLPPVVIELTGSRGSRI